MNDENFFDEVVETSHEALPSYLRIDPTSLALITRKVPIRFCEYKIGNDSKKMIQGETIAISRTGMTFNSTVNFPVGTLMRVLIEMPDYWSRKSRHVAYRHTDAPTLFQTLARVINQQEIGKRQIKHQLICHLVNMDPVDEIVLAEFLGIGEFTP